MMFRAPGRIIHVFQSVIISIWSLVSVYRDMRILKNMLVRLQLESLTDALVDLLEPRQPVPREAALENSRPLSLAFDCLRLHSRRYFGPATGVVAFFTPQSPLFRLILKNFRARCCRFFNCY